jgi:hypothetical protein
LALSNAATSLNLSGCGSFLAAVVFFLLCQGRGGRSGKKLKGGRVDGVLLLILYCTDVVVIYDAGDVVVLLLLLLL